MEAPPAPRHFGRHCRGQGIPRLARRAHFTFLGNREYRLGGRGHVSKLTPLVTSGIGILEDKDFHFLRAGTDYVEMTEQHVAWLNEPDPIMVTKANVRTRVHRRAYMDYVGVKLYGEGGDVTGELRIVGLFTSMALATPHTEVPLIRRKVSEVMRRSGYDPAGHAGKTLLSAPIPTHATSCSRSVRTRCSSSRRKSRRSPTARA